MKKKNLRILAGKYRIAFVRAQHYTIIMNELYMTVRYNQICVNENGGGVRGTRYVETKTEKKRKKYIALKVMDFLSVLVWDNGRISNKTGGDATG